MMLYIILFIILVLGKRDDSVIFILCRNEDLDEIKETIINFEKQFNKEYHYPYVFLNDKDWEENFKNGVKEVISGEVDFGKINPEYWAMPEHINKTVASRNWAIMRSKGVPYADQESYHNMCRFFSRAFYKHPLVTKYKYYWRIEPGVRFRCPIKYDPFELMENKQLLYGFTITLLEYMDSIPTLWQRTMEFQQMNRELIPKGLNHLNFMFNGTAAYNSCHFWSNFEIASFEFFRGQLYNSYVDYLESTGGFYYERWGDAPIHSLAAGLLMDRSKVHHFEDIGYTHEPYTHCPTNDQGCDCKTSESFAYKPGSCLRLYYNDIYSFNPIKKTNTEDTQKKF